VVFVILAYFYGKMYFLPAETADLRAFCGSLIKNPKKGKKRWRFEK